MRLFVTNQYVNKEYLDLFLQTLKNTLKKNKKGSAIPHLNPGVFYSFMVPLPPKQEQNRIVDKVNLLFKYIAEINSINDDILKLKILIKSRIIDLGINGKLLPADDNYYCEKILSEVADITMGQSVKSEYMSSVKTLDSIEFHQGKTFFSNKIIENSNIYAKFAKKIAKSESILFSVRAPVGAINYCDRDIAIGRGLAAIFPKSNLEKDYLYYLLYDASKKLIDASNGTTFDAIKKEQLFNLIVKVPPIRVQKQTISIITKCLEEISLI